MSERVALVTGANHGIGLATAAALAERGLDVLATYLRGTNRRTSNGTDDPSDGSSGCDEYDRARDADGAAVAAAVRATGRRCLTIEADLTDPAIPARLFDEAGDRLGPVQVLVHNASGWRPDSFAGAESDRIGRAQHPVTVETIGRRASPGTRSRKAVRSSSRIGSIKGLWKA